MENLQAQFKALCEQKEALESEMAELNEVLTSNSNVGMKGSLLDSEDYPRSDIDVYSVRHARKQIICLQNDHIALMKDIEEKLTRIHEYARETKTVSSGSQSSIPSSEKPKPFLTVNRVVTASPAAQAGLQTGDLVKEFGSVNLSNFKSLQDIAQVVQHSKDKIIKLVIERDNKEYRLELTPHVWSGRGLLGCNVVEWKP